MCQELQIRGHMDLSYKNHSDEIFNMLGIKPMEKFRIKTLREYEQKEYDGIFYLSSALVAYYNDGISCKDYTDYTVLPKLLSGSFKIIKGLSTNNIKPTPEEQTVINYCKLCGYKYLAKDKIGEIWAYKEKPEKRATMWLDLDNDDTTEIKYNLSFLSWEDEEPWVIE